MAFRMSGKGHVWALVPLLLASILAVLWWQGRFYESTDDAFIERNVLYIKPRIQGVVVEWFVKDNQAVNQGDPLAQLDPKPFQTAVAAAEANLQVAETEGQKARSEQTAFIADLGAREQNARANVTIAREDQARQAAELTTLDAQIDQSQREVKRYTTLQARQQVSKQLLEETATQLATLESRRRSLEATVKVAQAQAVAATTQLDVVLADKHRVAVQEAGVAAADAATEAAKAALETARLQLEWTTLRAPHDGIVSKVQARTGAQVDPSQALALLVYGEPWVQANFKETQLSRLQAGASVDITIDAYPDRHFQGHIESFQAGTGARFSLLPPENATGNFVKVVQRVPVRIEFDTPQDIKVPLWPGLSVEPKVSVTP